MNSNTFNFIHGAFFGAVIGFVLSLAILWYAAKVDCEKFQGGGNNTKRFCESVFK
jgi:high-affinity Fe2+/Pb2+ permease